MQFKLRGTDLDIVLALVRSGSLAGAGERLGVDASTVFRSVQRLERGLGQRLFERTRRGYLPLELARTLAESAELAETALESARSAVQHQPDQVSGTVRISTTDSVLHGLVAPCLKALRAAHPLLSYALHTGNELVSLTHRDADIAVRATQKPPPHLVGRYVGPIRVALFSARRKGNARQGDADAGRVPWIVVDDALPEHPSVLWRKRHFPKVVPAYRVNSILTVLEFVALGLGIGVLPIFLARPRSDLVALTEPLDECETGLWLLTHPESRHLRRISTVYGHLAQNLRLEEG